MNRLFISLILIKLFVSFSLAQAHLIDNLGHENSETWEKRTEGVRWGIKDNPTAKAYVIIQRGKKDSIGYSIRLAERLKNHFNKYLGLPNEKFVILIGEQTSSTQNTGLWLVPNGSEPPLDKSIEEYINPNESIKFDEFIYPNPLYVPICCAIDGYKKQESLASINEFAEILKENHNFNAYLIFYGQYCPDCSISSSFDSPKVINRILTKEKNYLIKNHKINSSRIFTINGGYREWQEIELWLIPKGEKPPKATPTTSPKKRKSKRK